VRPTSNREITRAAFERPTRSQKIENALACLIDKMFELAGHEVRFEDVKGRRDAWYQEWTMTQAQNEEWKSWGRDFLRKELKMGARQAELEMGMISMNYGLKFSDWQEIGE
jgi:hypothetical protein